MGREGECNLVFVNCSPTVQVGIKAHHLKHQSIRHIATLIIIRNPYYFGFYRTEVLIWELSYICSNFVREIEGNHERNKKTQIYFVIFSHIGGERIYLRIK
jgi:hypothetical protein